jgi:hypothetical protein
MFVYTQDDIYPFSLNEDESKNSPLLLGVPRRDNGRHKMTAVIVGHHNGFDGVATTIVHPLIKSKCPPNKTEYFPRFSLDTLLLFMPMIWDPKTPSDTNIIS